MTRTVKTVHVRALHSFNEIQKDDEADLELTPRVQGWINAGLMEVLGGGADQAGPGGAEPAAKPSVQG